MSAELSDRELLELAAKAAGIEGPCYISDNPMHTGIYRAAHSYYWNPLISDSEALRLAVKLRLEITHLEGGGVDVTRYGVSEPFGELLASESAHDECAATRRAIVRAAAAIGAQQ